MFELRRQHRVRYVNGGVGERIPERDPNKGKPEARSQKPEEKAKPEDESEKPEEKSEARSNKIPRGMPRLGL
jgi:hypothetical protein